MSPLNKYSELSGLSICSLKKIVAECECRIKWLEERQPRVQDLPLGSGIKRIQKKIALADGSEHEVSLLSGRIVLHRNGVRWLCIANESLTVEFIPLES